jgi:N-acyl amino acid synthase of PEP-CTERM/exosortase system
MDILASASSLAAGPADGTAGATAPVDLVSVYNHYFFYRIARTECALNAVFRLRYHVYCEETGFLSKDDNSDGLERDQFDHHSSQGLLVHRPTGRAAGAVRLVLPKADMPGCDIPARMFAPALDGLPESELPRATTGEISRFSISQEFRKRASDTLYASLHESGGGDPRRVIPHITLGLMTSIFDMTVEHGLTHLCAIIDPALLRLLGKLGLKFDPIGPKVDFHGPRQPVYAKCTDILDHLIAVRPEIYQVISNDGQFRLQ